MFDNYQQRDSELAPYYFYNYFKLVSIISNKTGKGIPFAKEYPHFLFVTQRFYNASSCKNLMTLFELLSFNKADKDAIQKGYPDINIQQNNIGMILRGLFIFSDRLQRCIFLYNATVSLYSSLF